MNELAYIDFEYGDQKRKITGTSEQMYYVWHDIVKFHSDSGNVLMARTLRDGSIETVKIDLESARQYSLFPKFT
jgi:hypothetical protein